MNDIFESIPVNNYRKKLNALPKGGVPVDIEISNTPDNVPDPQDLLARPLVDLIREGKTLQEVAELPEIKELLIKVSGFEQSQKMRTVLESNPRLASMQDKMTKAQELAATKSRKAVGEAADIAVSAVMDAYPEYAEPSGPALR